MILKKTFLQYAVNSNIVESDLTISVNYDAENDEIESTESVTVYNYKTGSYTDVTAIFAEQLKLDDLVDDIDWRELWAERNEKVDA